MAASIAQLRGRQIALLDWDGTMRPGFTVLDLMRHLAADGLIDPDALGEMRKAFSRYENDQISHDELAGETAALYAAGLAGVAVERLHERTTRFIVDDRKRLFPFAPDVFRLLRRLSVRAVVVSGAPEPVLLSYASEFQWPVTFALTLGEFDGKLTGSVRTNPGLSSTKRSIVREIESIAESVVFAMGNASSDLPLLESAKLAVIVDNPDLAASLGLENVDAHTLGTFDYVRLLLERHVVGVD